MADILPTKINYGDVRRRLKLYAENYGTAEEYNPIIERSIERLKKWKHQGFVYDNPDLELAVDSFKADIRRCIKEKDNKGKYGTICWTCYNSVPKCINGHYISGCNWSIHGMPVCGWKTDPDAPGTKVIDCPEYVKG